MSKPTLKQIISILVDALIEQHGESAALKTILTGCPDAYTRNTWQEDVKKLLSDPKSKIASRAASEKIYARIEALTDEKELTELLSRIPKGKPN